MAKNIMLTAAEEKLAAITDYAKNAAENEGFLIKFFSGALLKIEEYYE